MCDSNEFTIVFSYEYYIYGDTDDYDFYYEKIRNYIKNCNNIFKAIENDPYQIIFIENNDENYNEICKLAVQQNSYTLQCIKNQTDEICKLAVQQNGEVLYYVRRIQNSRIIKINQS